MPSHGRGSGGSGNNGSSIIETCVTCGHRGECISPTFVRTHHHPAVVNHPRGHQQQYNNISQFMHQPSTTAMIVNSSSNSISSNISHNSSRRRSPSERINNHRNQNHQHISIAQSADAASLMDVNGTYLCTTYNPGCIIMRKVINYAERVIYFYMSLSVYIKDVCHIITKAIRFPLIYIVMCSKPKIVCP